MNRSPLNKFISLPRPTKRLIMMLVDSVMLVISLLASFSLRLGEWYWPEGNLIWLVFGAPIIAIPIFIRFGLYRAVVRYIGFKALWMVAQAVTLYALIWGVAVLLSGLEWFPRSVTLTNWLVGMLLIGGSRMVARWWVSGMHIPTGTSTDRTARKRVVIYGAGGAGVQLANALTYSHDLRPVAFIDDDKSLKGQQISGLRIYGFSDLSHLIEKRGVAEVLLAMPSLSRVHSNEIITLLEPYPILVRTVPSVSEIAQGQVKIDDLREVSIEDLLGRDPVPPNQDLLHSNIEGKVVMVTGAGGSIGSELCRQIVQLSPAMLILYEQHEYALYAMEQELLEWVKESGSVLDGQTILPILASVTDQERLEQVCRGFGVQTIYHTAAYKHVPMVERNPGEAINNNIFGTLRAAQAAIESGVETFVLISTDKAVRPTNTMGATKRFAELILQALSGDKKLSRNTRFTMVRFGNVLGSSGSVVPLFREQISSGGPVTVTDSKIIRYFMTIPEAAELVIQAGAMGQGGDVFVLDMGEPVLIVDLARRMIRLSGFEVKDEDHPNGDIEIIYTGLRPGEKLYEELLIGDNVLPTEHEKIMRAEEEVIGWKELALLIDGLQISTDSGDFSRVRELLQEAVSGFNPQCGVVDELTLALAGRAKRKSNVVPL